MICRQSLDCNRCQKHRRLRGTTTPKHLFSMVFFLKQLIVIECVLDERELKDCNHPVRYHSLPRRKKHLTRRRLIGRVFLSLAVGRLPLARFVPTFAFAARLDSVSLCFYRKPRIYIDTPKFKKAGGSCSDSNVFRVRKSRKRLWLFSSNSFFCSIHTRVRG